MSTAAENKSLVLRGTQDHLPEHMRGVDDFGTDKLTRFMIPPRVKVVQSNAKVPYNQFDAGTLILAPAMVIIAHPDKDANGKPIIKCLLVPFVPLFYYEEWCVWNPIEMKGRLPSIRTEKDAQGVERPMRSFDPMSEIARIANDPDERQSYPCPEMPTKMLKYVEHLNFLVAFVDEASPLFGMSALLGFARGGHRDGRAFANKIKMRRAPMWGCRFAMTIGPRQKEGFDWIGINVDNPPENSGIAPLVAEKDLYQALTDQKEEARKNYEAGLIRADYGDDEEELEVAPKDAKAEF